MLPIHIVSLKAWIDSLFVLEQQEWKERESKALDKFNQRCNKPAASPGTQDTQRAAQEELRQRLALETKRMEDAEAAKTKGNALLSAKKYADAVGSYSEAVRLWPTNAVKPELRHY